MWWCVKWAPVPVTFLLIHLCADGLMHSEDWPASSSGRTECFTSRVTGCMCGFAMCKSTPSEKSENFTLKCCKYHKHCKHFKVRHSCLCNYHLGTCHPWGVEQTHSHMEMYWFVPELVNEVLQAMLLKSLAPLLKADAVGFSACLFDFHLPPHELPLTTHHQAICFHTDIRKAKESKDPHGERIFP